MLYLTLAPLPELTHIFDALTHRIVTDDTITAPWCRPGDEVFCFSRSAWSLMVIAKWRMRVTNKKIISFWLPDFFCNMSLIPLRQLEGIQLRFYPVTEELEPDYTACHRMAEEANPDLFVLVHYFGQPAAAKTAGTFCAAFKACLIEDAAHVLQPIPGVGDTGDFVLYSPHKHLPIPDGAVLLACKEGPTRLATHDPELNLLHQIFRDIKDSPGFTQRPVRVWLIKRILQRMGVRSRRVHLPSFGADVGLSIAGVKHPKMSQLSRCLLGGLLDGLDRVARLRQQHRQYCLKVIMIQGMNQSTIRPVSAEYPPYLAGFAFDNMVLAEKTFIHWQSAGLPVTTWPDIPPEVLNRPEHHSVALHLRRTRVYLPVHQSLDQRQIAACGERLLKGGYV